MGDTTNRLIAWMGRRDMKQIELARHMGISESAVSLIVNERRPISNSFTGAFAKTFSHADFDEVFGSVERHQNEPEAA